MAMMNKAKQRSTQTDMADCEKSFGVDFVLIALTVFLFLGILSFLFYKTSESGMGGDEAVAFFEFSQSYKDAYTKYHKAGNHIIYSILAHLSYKLFSSYEHFVRIPSVIAGVIFMGCVLLILLRMIRTRLILPAVLVLILTNRFVFSYAFMARGYALVLGAIFVQIVFVLWLLRKKISFRFCWVPIVVMSLLNAFIMGSMLSCLQIMVAMNVCIVLASPFFYKDSIRRGR